MLGFVADGCVLTKQQIWERVDVRDIRTWYTWIYVLGSALSTSLQSQMEKGVKMCQYELSVILIMRYASEVNMYEGMTYEGLQVQ